MSNLNFSKEQKYYGGKEHRPPKIIRLKAGPVSCQYESGYLRYLNAGGTELLRMIYPAVRDHNWGTIAPQISDEKIVVNEDHFEISYDCLYEGGEVAFQAKYSIKGSADGEVSFQMDGSCLQPFRKNRIGFNLLHPPEAAGAKVIIGHTNGEEDEGTFPLHISPHQPFMDIRFIRWLQSGLWAKVNFEGDIFEMEDQRNWTDASFKTYSTPLAIPFPVRLEKGDKIIQSVKLSLESTDFSKHNSHDKSVSLSLENERYPLPQIGIGQSSEIKALTDKDIAYFNELNLSHYRVDLHLSQADLEKNWLRALNESRQLNLPLALALYFKKNTVRELGELKDFTEDHKPAVKQLLVFSEDHKSSPSSMLEQVLPDLRDMFPEAQIGAGTDCFFTELNRERVNPEGLDFLTYSINPQVHQFDNQSLVETLQAQSYTVESARQFAGGLPIHISPISLKMRFNPNATGPEPESPEGELPLQADNRQMSLFAAGWTIGSIKYLTESRVSAVTYYETLGRRGVMQGDHHALLPEKFAAVKGMVFPIYWVFYKLLKEKGIQIIKTQSSHPHQVDGLAWEVGNEQYILLANYQAFVISVSIDNWPDHFEQKVLDEENFEKMALHFDDFISGAWAESKQLLKLRPYSIFLLRINRNGG
ncbi:hypothetical protein OKW21_001823 [Catalinimonas alkaloidigena]|uniref:hypothetical protein n=1 Tax=Catalinimonas alkaloidigena TaxID=1075417 RepID=UPI0024063357|nr:hypothetical protein [Catalinimonas alkaloidigena]MDF9796560.1 hypothetical protein [Catalinimonas alkaloidigena]